MAGQSAGIQIDTGFDSWSNSGDFLFSDGKTPLLKLHGSIDWALSDGQISDEKPLPYQVIQKVDPNAEKGGFRPEVIFGGRNKLTARGPFLSLLRSFEQQLSKVEMLTIIGYSFRDEHVNEFIINWFNGEIARSIRVIDPNPNSSDKGFMNSLLTGRGKDRVQIIRETAKEGIARLLQ
jgi:hypothetical protein